MSRRASNFAWPVVFLSAIAFILLLLSTLSVPIIRSIYLVSIQADTFSGTSNSGTSRADLGVFGVCGSGLRLNTGGSPFSLISACSRSELGWTLNGAQRTTGGSAFTNDVILGSSLTTGLVMIPIAASFAGATGILGIIAACGQCSGWWTTIGIALSTVMTWIAFIISVIVIALARTGISSRDNSRINGVRVSTKVGATMPLILVAAVLLLFAFVLSIISAIRTKRANKYHDHPTANTMDLTRANTAGSQATYAAPAYSNGAGRKISQ